jgi:hypothetical protein
MAFVEDPALEEHDDGTGRLSSWKSLRTILTKTMIQHWHDAILRHLPDAPADMI